MDARQAWKGPHEGRVAIEGGARGLHGAGLRHRALGGLAGEKAHQGHRGLSMRGASGHGEMGAARGARGGRGPVAARQGREPDLAADARLRQLEEIGGVGPAPEKHGLALAERAAGDLLVGGGNPGRAQPFDDEPAQESQRGDRALGLGKHAAVRASTSVPAAQKLSSALTTIPSYCFPCQR